MKINDNGVTREMTSEEVAEMERMQEEIPPVVLSTEAKLAAQAQEIADLKEALTMLLEGVTEDG